MAGEVTLTIAKEFELSFTAESDNWAPVLHGAANYLRSNRDVEVIAMWCSDNRYGADGMRVPDGVRELELRLRCRYREQDQQA